MKKLIIYGVGAWLVWQFVLKPRDIVIIDKSPDGAPIPQPAPGTTMPDMSQM